MIHLYEKMEGLCGTVLVLFVYFYVVVCTVRSLLELLGCCL